MVTESSSLTPSPARYLKARALFIAMVCAFSTTHSYASDPEVAVTGCVVDFGGKPYKNIDIELKGLNYRGGAGYANNNSVTRTDSRGEFVVRMKAGEPPPGQPATAQLRATIEGQFRVHGWSGQSSDVAQRINVSNMGKPVDLRLQGCLRYPWPISVGGVIAMEEPDDKAYEAVKVHFTAGGTSDRLAVLIPSGVGRLSSTSFDLLVTLSEGDPYAVVIRDVDQPKGLHCVTGPNANGIAGQRPTEEGGQNYWVTNPIRIHCSKRQIKSELPAESGDAAPAPADESPVALRREGGSSGAAMFQQAIGQAEQDKDRPAPVSGPPQTALERMTSSYDQRIDAARTACASSERNCNTGCMGVAAVGVFSLFAGSSAAAAAASEQAQQCSNRCEQSKSSCDQQVSALEQEKSQAVADATNPAPTGTGSVNPSAAPSNMVASGGGRGCREILESLERPINDGNPMIAAGANLRYPNGQIYSDQVWSAQAYMRVANTHPACANDQSSREAVAASLRSVQAYCRQAESLRSGGPFNCNSGQSYGGTAERVEAAIRQLFQESTAERAAVSSVRSENGECKAAVDRQEIEFRSISQRIDNTSSAVGQMQLLMDMLAKRMALLDRLCRGQPQYANYADAKRQFDSSMQNCRGIATNPSECRPNANPTRDAQPSRTPNASSGPCTPYCADGSLPGSRRPSPPPARPRGIAIQ